MTRPKTQQRFFGKWHVRLDGITVDIVGDWYSNRGLIYPHMIDRFLDDPVHTQIIGMDSERGITEQVLAYIHRYVKHNADALKTL